MFQTNYTSIREIQRNYKKLSREVNKTDTPTIVLSNNEPQFAIISLKTLTNLQVATFTKSAQALLELGNVAKKEKAKGPKDLSIHHDEYAWDE